MGDIRICFVGDSFVNGTGDDTALGWVGRVCASARARGVQLTSYNLGIRRNTSRDVLNRWHEECSRRLPASCDRRVVLSFGVNDTVIEEGVTRIPPRASCDAFRRIADAMKREYHLLFVSPPSVADDEHNARIADLSAAFSRDADRLGVPYVDIFTPLVADRDYREQIVGGDGAHPAAGGYALIAQHVLSPARSGGSATRRID